MVMPAIAGPFEVLTSLVQGVMCMFYLQIDARTTPHNYKNTTDVPILSGYSNLLAVFE